MQICLSEIAVVVNCGPITFVGTDVENKNPLTPSHFLLGQGNQSLQIQKIQKARQFMF